MDHYLGKVHGMSNPGDHCNSLRSHSANNVLEIPDVFPGKILNPGIPGTPLPLPLFLKTKINIHLLPIFRTRASRDVLDAP